MIGKESILTLFLLQGYFQGMLQYSCNVDRMYTTETAKKNMPSGLQIHAKFTWHYYNLGFTIFFINALVVWRKFSTIKIIHLQLKPQQESFYLIFRA